MKLLRYSIWFIFLGLFIANLFVFVYGVNLGTQVSIYEKGIKNLKQENTELERKAYSAASLTHAASMAAQLNFTKTSSPVYLDSLKTALNR